MKRGALAALLVVPLLLFGMLLAFVVLAGGVQQQLQSSQSCSGDSPTTVIVDAAGMPSRVGAYSGAQLVGAAGIMRAAKDAGVSVRGATIGVMTSMGESGLTAVERGDAVGPDSLGWFQQRAPWGSREKRLDAYASATMFFTGGDGGQSGLLDVSMWETMSPTAAAHAVQRNADPNYYTRFWDPAVAVVGALAGVQVDIAPGTGDQVCTAEPPGQLPVADGAWVKPTAGPVTSGFGMRWGAMHNGLDFGAPCGTPVYAAAAGTVVLVAKNNVSPATGYGTLVGIDHGGGLVTRYAHAANQDVLVQVGQVVKAGEQVTRVGTYGNSTGCHLHFEVQQGGRFVDPAPILRTRGVPLNG